MDNTGHILTDGTLFPRGQSVTTSLLAEVDYGVTRRFAATASVPFIFAKYTGDLPPFSGLERDACRCWHQSFQDFAFSGRYRFGDEFWALTPQVRYIQPTHDYLYRGEAVVGPNLQQLADGHQLRPGGLRRYCRRRASRAARPSRWLSRLLKAGGPNRSNVSASFGYALTRSLDVHGGGLYEKNHGGLTVFDMAGAPPEKNAQADRPLKMRYWHFTGGVSYSTRFADLFVAVEPYVWGRDTHDGVAYTAGSTWYFDFSKRKP